MNKDEIIEFFDNESKATKEYALLSLEHQRWIKQRDIAMKEANNISGRMSKISRKVERDHDIAADKLDKLCPNWREVMVK